MFPATSAARWSLIAAFAATLSACGGGGGGSGTQSPQPQSIAFAQPGPLYKFVGDADFSNVASGGGGTGAITYSSDTPAVASVNSGSGLVAINASGVAQISADKAADAAYQSAQASYQLRIAPRSVNVTAWIGPADTQVSLGALALTLEVAHATDLGCNPTAVLGCSNGAQVQTTSTPLVDSTTTQSQTSIYWLEHGPNISAGITIPENRFQGTKVEDSVVVNGTLWVLTFDGANDDIWSSADGANWVLVGANVLGSAQSDVHLLYNANAFWILAGSPTGNMVWSSADASKWTQLSVTTNFPARDLFAAASFNGRLWVFGGANSVGVDQKDLWSSSDGVTWIENNSAVLPYGREQLAMLAFNGKLWIIGGWNSGVAYRDVWSSPDGATWTEATASAAFGGLFGERAVSDGSQLWVFGGLNGYQTAQQGVWSSADGANWSLASTPVAAPIGAYNFDAAWFNGAYWLFGGFDGAVWSSATGAQWSMVTLNARLPETMALTATSYQGKIWAVGTYMELFSSSDGLNWSTVTPTLPGPNGTPLLMGLPDRLMMITSWGYTAPNRYQEVWQSTDGANWTELSATVPFSSWGITQTVYYNGKIWAFSTNITDNVTPEIWSTTDGVNWTLAVSNPAFAPRTGYQVIVFKNQMYVVGGSNNANVPLNDVWVSTDGATWTSPGPTNGLPAQAYNMSLTLADSMCALGSVAPYPAQGVWCSSDGINWSNVTEVAPQGPIAELNGDLFIVGNGVNWRNDTDLVWKSSDATVWRLGYQNTFQFE